MRRGGTLDCELDVSVFWMLYGELHECLADERPLALTECEGKLAQHARILVGKALDGEVYASAFISFTKAQY